VLEVSGRSSIGRRGLFVENAGFIDPGFGGQITLELLNARPQPLVLRVGQKICQVKISQLGQPAERPYGSSKRRSKYQGQCGATSSRLQLDPSQAEFLAAWEAQKALLKLR
jgi:dCTP deaminase